MKKEKRLTGVIDFGGDVGKVYDEDIYQFILKHSNVFQRMNSRKVLEMYDVAFAMLTGSIPTPEGKFNLLRK